MLEGQRTGPASPFATLSNHLEFIKAITDRRNVKVQFVAAASHGALERVCAPLSYGLRDEIRDGRDRYWFWDYTGHDGIHALGLFARQIVTLQVVAETFDPAELRAPAAPQSFPGGGDHSHHGWGINE